MGHRHWCARANRPKKKIKKKNRKQKRRYKKNIYDHSIYLRIWKRSTMLADVISMRDWCNFIKDSEYTLFFAFLSSPCRIYIVSFTSILVKYCRQKYYALLHAIDSMICVHRRRIRTGEISPGERFVQAWNTGLNMNVSSIVIHCSASQKWSLETGGKNEKYFEGFVFSFPIRFQTNWQRHDCRQI